MSKKEGKEALKKKTLCFSFCAFSPLSNTWNKLVMFALFKQRLL